MCETLLIRVLEGAINKPIKQERSVILGSRMAAITDMSSHVEEGGWLTVIKTLTALPRGWHIPSGSLCSCKARKGKKKGKEESRI